MKQVVQPASGGPVRVLDVPRPTIGPTEVLVQTLASVISPGTERAVTQLAQASLLAKARARPDLVRKVLAKARTDGVLNAARSVRARLDDDVPLGYSAAGTVVELGEAVAGISPGQLVATGGAGKANHAEFQAVPGLLCSPVPVGVPASDAAFATVASVALHGLRLTEVGPGAKVVIVGLGLIGQLGVRLALAAGYVVAAIDLAEGAVELARSVGAMGLVETGDETTKAVLEWSRGRGADAVLLTAATASSSAVGRVPALCRDRAVVVVVGDVGLDLERRPFYDRELSLRFARSYGPGRYEPSYENWGVDYPPGLVRWSEGRNLEAVLDLLTSGRLTVADLVTHRFPIADAAAAYDIVDRKLEPSIAIQFDYEGTLGGEGPIEVRRPSPPSRHSGPDEPGVGFIGAGAFASTVLVPAFRKAEFRRLVSVCSASGISARRLAERSGFERAVSGGDEVIHDPDVQVVVVATPHASHASLTAEALRAGKHVFCEKPLALSIDELSLVEEAWRDSGSALFVGFNRRWSEPVGLVGRHLSASRGPVVITYRVNAGPLPESHWFSDRREGGRLLGEVCHFVDTCAAIVGEDAIDVHAMAGGAGEVILQQELVVALRYPGGSVAAITYATGGHRATEKEHIEVLGRDRSARIVDFGEVFLDGRSQPLAARDKGHLAEARAFRRAIVEGDERSTRSAIASTRTTLLAASALTRAG